MRIQKEDATNTVYDRQLIDENVDKVIKFKALTL